MLVLGDELSGIGRSSRGRESANPVFAVHYKAEIKVYGNGLGVRKAP